MIYHPARRMMIFECILCIEALSLIQFMIISGIFATRVTPRRGQSRASYTSASISHLLLFFFGFCHIRSARSYRHKSIDLHTRYTYRPRVAFAFLQLKHRPAKLSTTVLLPEYSNKFNGPRYYER